MDDATVVNIFDGLEDGADEISGFTGQGRIRV